MQPCPQIRGAAFRNNLSPTGSPRTCGHVWSRAVTARALLRKGELRQLLASPQHRVPGDIGGAAVEAPSLLVGLAEGDVVSLEFT